MFLKDNVFSFAIGKDFLLKYPSTWFFQVSSVFNNVFAQLSQIAAYAQTVKDAESALLTRYPSLGQSNSTQHIELILLSHPTYGVYTILCDLHIALWRMRSTPIHRLSREDLLPACPLSTRRRAVFRRNVFLTCAMKANLQRSLEALSGLV